MTRMLGVALAVALTATSAAAGNDEPPARPDATIAMVYEDARLYIAPDVHADYLEAGARVTPRATRPFAIAKHRGEWVELQSFTTADTGKLSICPMPGLTDLKVRLFVRASDIERTLDLSKLPPRKSAVLEYATDACRNPKASPVTVGIRDDDPLRSPPDLEAPPIGLGPYLPPKTPLTWKDGTTAGQTRYAVALPISYTSDPTRVCFERTLIGPIGFSMGRATATLCAPSSALVRR